MSRDYFPAAQPDVLWRVGGRVKLNVYEGNNPGRPICQCHTVEDAQRIVDAVNTIIAMRQLEPLLK